MKILVTGGAGFIGFHTCQELIIQGHEVVIFDDMSTGKRQNLDDLGVDSGLDDIDFVFGDATVDSPELANAMEGVDAIMHLAAKVSVRDSIESPRVTSATNLQAFINIADLARLRGINRIVYASSAAIYGDQQDFYFKHSSDAIPRDPKNLPLSPYGLDKLTNEAYADLFNQLYHMQTIGLRYFNVYGPRQDPQSPYAGVIGKFISLALNGETLSIFGDGEQVRNFIYVEDIAKVNAAAVTGSFGFKDFQGVVNVAKVDGVVSINKLVRELNKIIAKPISVAYQDASEGEIKISIPTLENFISLYPNSADMKSLDDGLTELVSFLKTTNK